jgi:transcription initiation factor TFIIB
MAPAQCPSCESSTVFYDGARGELICTRCGLVILDRSISTEPDWRGEPGKETGRADLTSGLDITQHDFGLGSNLGISGDLPPSWRARLRRLQMWQRRSRTSSYAEKSLWDAMLELDKLCEDLSLPKGIRAEVSALYRKVKRARLTTGRNTWNVLAALTFLTCKLRHVPRTELEVARALAARTDAKVAAALRSIRNLTKLFKGRLGLHISRTMPEEYVDRFASQLNMSKGATARAHKLCTILPERLRRTKPATLLAATALYIAAKEAGEAITLRRLASLLGVGISSLCQTAKSVRSMTEPHQG